MIEHPQRSLDFRCSTCGYGVARAQPPERCPMCAGDRWHRHPQKQARTDLRLELPPAKRSTAASRRGVRAPAATEA